LDSLFYGYGSLISKKCWSKSFHTLVWMSVAGCQQQYTTYVHYYIYIPLKVLSALVLQLMWLTF
jgi:hypothetical protein